MKNIFLLISFAFISLIGFSQDTTIAPTPKGVVTIQKDPRLDVLAKKEAEYNLALASGIRSTKGYRLMLLSTNDRAFAMNVRTQLLQRYPDQKVYMLFQPPYIKLKFGNFLEKDEADKMRQEISKSKLITTNIYIVPETIEIRLDKLKENESM